MDFETGKETDFIKKDLKALGSMSTEERWVGVIFLATAFLWMFKFILPFTVSDTAIAIFGALLLFLIPSKKAKDCLNGMI